jgi:hypothetical protein
MKTAVIGDDSDGLIVYNRALVDLARHYGFQPGACRPYRAKTKGKVERPFRYIREDFFLGGAFRTASSAIGSIRSPTRACTRRPKGCSMRPSPKKSVVASLAPLALSVRAPPREASFA